ncbi:MAG: adenylyl-sulfate kinase [Cyclobacteriaceae bacterium]
MRDPNVIPHQHAIKQEDRTRRYGYQAKLLWFTGLSGSGKSTLASELEKILFTQEFHTYILDGDNVRSGLNVDLSFSNDDRVENIRRIAEVSKLFLDAGVMVLTAFISPFKEDREKAKKVVGENNFLEIFVDTPFEICEKRDVKGLYKKARAGEIKNFTGLDSPFEPPQKPDIHLKTEGKSVTESLDDLLAALKSKKVI